MAKFKLRDLFTRYPKLDAFRLNLLTWISTDWSLFFTRTYRVTKLYAPGSEAYLKNALSRDRRSEPVIIALYHGRMVGLMEIHPREKITILISQSRDGEIIARACRSFGFKLARGSNRFGGFQGARELIEASEAGQSLAFTVDGPRGPRERVNNGVIRLAQVTGFPIIPFVARARTTYWMRSWDRFMAPLWGTPIVYLFGEPLLVPSDISEADRETLRADLDVRMRALRDRADEMIRAV